MDHLTAHDAQHLILHSRAVYYKYGDKPIRLLARHLRRQSSSRLICQVKDSSGDLVSDPLPLSV